MSWEHQGYIYYGNKDLQGLPLATPQQADEMNCWARALGALIGVSWSTVAKYAALDDLIDGQLTENTRKNVEELNKELAKQIAAHRISEPGRWYSEDWKPDMLEKKFPCALRIDGHFVVALGIGIAKNAIGRPKIAYWDTDCTVHYENLKEFVESSHPQYSFVMVAR